MKGRTSFVIAHRLSTIRDADMILYMEDGNIKEIGKPLTFRMYLIYIDSFIIHLSELKSTKFIVTDIINLFPCFLDMEIKSQVQGAIAVIQSYYDRSQNGELTEEEAK